MILYLHDEGCVKHYSTRFFSSLLFHKLCEMLLFPNLHMLLIKRMIIKKSNNDDDDDDACITCFLCRVLHGGVIFIKFSFSIVAPASTNRSN